jgi:hypothetical protein
MKAAAFAVLATAVLASPAALASNKIILGTGAGNAGESGISVDASITNDVSIHAFSLSIAYDPATFTLREITAEGTATAEVGAEFFNPTIDDANGIAVLGVILSIGDPYSNLKFEPSPESAHRVAVLRFDLAAGAPPGDYPIDLIDDLGSPPVSNVFSSAGSTIHPVLQDGTVTVNNENVFRLDTLTTPPGRQVTFMARAKHPATLQGYSIAFLFDKSILTFVDATVLGTDAALSVRPQTIEAFSPSLQLDFSSTLARLTISAVVDSVPPFTAHEIPASPDSFQSLAKITFDVADDPALLGTGTDLVFHDGGPTERNNILVVGEESYTPAFEDGRIDFGSVPIFLRGSINSDSTLDISDGIAMLGYLFLGESEPECMDAADVNDDNRTDLSDAISVFTFLFSGGLAPRAPFDACGPDPTPSDLGCVQSSQCP